jgi:hypothetical protein
MKLSGREVTSLMRRHKKTIRCIAKSHQITLKRIREVRTKGVEGFSAEEWSWIITGQWPRLTPRQIEDGIRQGYYRQKDIDVLYARRAEFVQNFKTAGTIKLSNVIEMDRLGRADLASDCWNLCTQEAKQALLTDSHSHVRSAALMSQLATDK